MKFNWSTILVIAMASFIILIVSMGIRMASSPSELYEEDYYDKGEAYEERMDQMRHGKAIDLHLSEEGVLILEHQTTSFEVTSLRLINLSDASRDFGLPPKHWNGQKVMVPLSEVLEGSWMIEIEGLLEGQIFFIKQEL